MSPGPIAPPVPTPGGWASPQGPTLGSAGGPPKARARSQVAVYAVCAAGVMIPAVALGLSAWGLILCVALAVGNVVGLAADLDRFFDRVTGVVVAGVSFIVLVFLEVLLDLFATVTLPFGVVLGVCALVVGLDWARIDRLRPLPFLSGFPVVLGMLSKEVWTFPAGVVWLVLAFGALSLLEADRRASQPRAQPPSGAPAPAARVDDIATTVLVALGLALVAALVLSVPSCQHRQSSANGGSGSGQGSGSGSGSGTGTGTGTGSGSGSGGTTDHRYVPDPDGRFLVPRNGSGTQPGDPTVLMPAPDKLPELEPGSSRVERFPDGEVATYRRLPNGDYEVRIEKATEDDQVFRYHPQPDGLTRIDQYDEKGNRTGRYWYDPQGKVVRDTQPERPSPRTTERPKAPKKRNPIHWPSAKVVLAVLAAAVALGLLIWWLVKRSPRADVDVPLAAPPWALALAARIDSAGRDRGRPRRRSESVVAFGRSLVDGPLPDQRLTQVTEVVSQALFSRQDPGPEAQRWAETTFDQIEEAHPVERQGRGRGGQRSAETVTT